MSLQFEMRMMPLELEAKKRCVEYLVNVLRMSDRRLVKLVESIQALERSGKREYRCRFTAQSKGV